MSVIGSTISHYMILGKLGEGGMGVVYKAEDLRLGRPVALKFLPPVVYSGGVERERFLLEAKAASALSHPAICTIYGIEEEEGKPFIVMEFVEGETLREKLNRGPVEPRNVLDWGAQFADGLAAAHEKGIVHRDIKPENLIVRPDGRAQILDFGLAKWRGTASLSIPGSTIGTLAYMSPEQIQGLDVDPRSDIFALGAVMYELLTGRPPFTGTHDAALLYSIVNTYPLPLESLVPDLAPAISGLVVQCMARRPEKRFQTARELSSALRTAATGSSRHVAGAGSSLPVAENVSSPPAATSSGPEDRNKGAGRSPKGRSGFTRIALVVSAVVLLGIAGLGIFFVFRSTATGISSLAILPLRNASADSSIDYLSDGLTESIISKLSRLSTVKVMSRSSVFHYKGKDVDPQAAGKELGVQGVLVGEVVPREGFVTISVELLNTRDNTQIWGDQFRRKETELFALQDDVSKEIVQNLRLRLTPDESERFSKPQTGNAEAYELYLKGRYHLNKRTRVDLEESIRQFRGAVEKDPGYAAAYAGVASAYDVMVAWAYVDPQEGVREAEKNARKALELDERLGEAHAALAGVIDFQYDRLGALKEYQRAVELSPGDANAQQWYAEELAMLGRFDEAFPIIRHAQELDPLSFIIPAVAAVFYANAHRQGEAVEIAQKLVDLDPRVPMGHLALGLAWTRSGKYPEAIGELEKGVAISDSETTMLSWLGCAYALGGRRGDALRIAEKLDRLSIRSYVSTYLRGLLYTALGEKENALALLDEGVVKHDGWMGQTYEEIMFDPLRNDPRYKDIVKRLGLAQ
jgi:serine/threonine-protein kinase